MDVYTDSYLHGQYYRQIYFYRLYNSENCIFFIIIYVYLHSQVHSYNSLHINTYHKCVNTHHLVINIQDDLGE